MFHGHLRFSYTLQKSRSLKTRYILEKKVGQEKNSNKDSITNHHGEIDAKIKE